MAGVDGEYLSTFTHYHPAFPSRAKALGGKWEKTLKVWRFPFTAKQQVIDLLNEVYGCDQYPPPHPFPKAHVYVRKSGIFETHFCGWDLICRTHPWKMQLSKGDCFTIEDLPPRIIEMMRDDYDEDFIITTEDEV